MTNWYVDEALGTDDLSHGTGPGADAFKSLYYAVVESGLLNDSDTVNVAAGTYNPGAPIAVVKSLVHLGDVITPSDVVVNAPLTAGLYDRDCFQVLADAVTIEGYKLVGAMDDKPDHHPAWGQPGRQNAGIMVGSDPTLTTHGVLRGVSGGKFSHNEIVDGSKGIYLYHAKDCEVSHNNITTTKGQDPDNFYDILGWNGDGIHVYLERPSDYPTGNIITLNTMDNVRVGVFLNGDSIGGIDPTAWDFRGVVIEGNVLTNVWNAGIILQCASGTVELPIVIKLNEIDTSTGRRNGDEGNERGLISVHGDYVEVTENILTRSEEHGIWADGHHLTVAANASTLHTKDGIIVGAYKKVEPNNGWTLPEITREDITIELNAIRECRVGCKICDGSNKDISVLRNLIEECLVAGISFQEELENLRVVGNDIKNNPVGIACDVEGDKASDVRIHLNSIEGNVVGVKNDYQAEPQDIDARFNWWGSPDGPGGVADGHGDPVTEHILFEPFLTACPVHGSCKVEVVEGDSPVVSNPDAGIVLEGIDLQYASSGVLGSVKLDDMPVTSKSLQEATRLTPVKFVDVFGTGLSGGRIKITVSCAEELAVGFDAKTLKLYIWYEGAWHLGEDAGVDVPAKTVWGTFNAVDLNGAPGAVGGMSKTNWIQRILADIATVQSALEAILGRKYSFMDFWSLPADLISVEGAAADLDFPDVVVSGLPSGTTLKRVVVILTIRAILDTSTAANYIDQASKTLRVKKSTGAWGTDDVVGVTFDQNSLYCVASTKEAGPTIIGSHDVKGEVDGDATYNFRSEETQRGDAISALANDLDLYDVQVGLRVFYE